MLKAASLTLGPSAHVLSSVARTRRSLEQLHSELEPFTGTHHQLQLDWNNPQEFLRSLSSHIQRVGIPSTVVAWLHEDSLGPEVARLCSSEAGSCEFFQVRGSAAGMEQAHLQEFAAQFRGLPGVNFRQVILGAVKTLRGSRWLSHAEISAGVLAAIRSNEPVAIVGTLGQ